MSGVRALAVALVVAALACAGGAQEPGPHSSPQLERWQALAAEEDRRAEELKHHLDGNADSTSAAAHFTAEDAQQAIDQTMRDWEKDTAADSKERAADAALAERVEMMQREDHHDRALAKRAAVDAVLTDAAPKAADAAASTDAGKTAAAAVPVSAPAAAATEPAPAAATASAVAAPAAAAANQEQDEVGCTPVVVCDHVCPSSLVYSRAARVSCLCLAPHACAWCSAQMRFESVEARNVSVVEVVRNLTNATADMPAEPTPLPKDKRTQQLDVSARAW